MTREQLYTFVTSLLGGLEMDETLFETFLDVAQMYWENQRPWMYLRTVDSSNSVPVSNSFTTAYSLPSNFRRWYSRSAITLVDSNNNPVAALREVPMQDKFFEKNNISKFYCDYANGNFYVLGAPSVATTAHLYYIKKGTLVSAASTNSWLFPSEYHKILGLSVAVYYKLGVDYDLVNNAQADANASLARQIFDMMSEWDGGIQAGSIEGRDYVGTGQTGGIYPNNATSGNVNFNA